VSNEEQLQWEARFGRPAAYAGFAAGLALLVAPFMIRSALGTGDLAEQFEDGKREGGLFLAGTGIQALGFLGIAFVLWYLFRVVKHRRPELLQAALYLGVGGAITFGLQQMAVAVEFLSLADEFAQTRIPENVDALERAEALADDSAIQSLNFVGLAAVFGVAFGILLVSLNGARVGVLNRFISILGMIVAALLVLFSGQIPFIQSFWLVALGGVFLNQWPGGRGPAWESGEAEPWPSAAQRAGAAPAQGGESEDSPPELEHYPEPVPQRPSSRKRKRKRR
jgi:hypothetical protein